MDAESGPLRKRLVHCLPRAANWQDRPEFDELCEWWRDTGAGVFALVGIGGSGKTAMADHFIRVLPTVTDDTTVKRNDLPLPRELFVFSFYQESNPGSFFPRLTSWLERQPYHQRDPKWSCGRAIEILEDRHAQARSLLLVLDGLKRIQCDGLHRLGNIEDYNLRDFISRISEGHLKGVAAIVTSRLPLSDLDSRRPPNYLCKSIERITDAVAISILKGRGVVADDRVLSKIARACGHHALTVDLAGGYIVHFGKGDPSTPLNFPSAEELAAAVRSSSEARELTEQRKRLSRIAGQYMMSMGPECAVLLERLCLFYHGANAATLGTMLAEPGSADDETPAIDPGDVKRRLQFLSDDLHLITESAPEPVYATPESSSNRGPAGGGATLEPNYSVHPAVRDGVLQSTGKLRVEAARRRAFIQLIKSANIDMDEVRRAKDRSPWQSIEYDDKQLVQLEEIIWQAAGGDFWDDAVDIYWHVLGGYGRLSHQVCNYQMGMRITSNLLQRATKDGHRGERRCIVMCDLAGFNRQQGRLDQAIKLYEEAAAEADECGATEWAWVARRNIGHVLLLRGFLCSAEAHVQKLAQVADVIDLNDPWVMDTRTGLQNTLGGSRLLQGQVSQAEVDLQRAYQSFKRTNEEDEPKYLGYPKIWHVLLLVLLGRFGPARQLLAEIDAETEGGRWSNLRRWCDYYDMLIHVAQDSQAEAERGLLIFKNWVDSVQNLAATTLYHRARATWLCQRLLATLRTGGEQRQIDQQRLSTFGRTIEDGLRIARRCGFGTYHIDLLLLQAQQLLLAGRCDDADRAIDVALYQGVQRVSESQPDLPHAEDPRCNYKWGIAEGQHLRGEVLLYRAARQLGRAHYDPQSLGALPLSARDLIAEARTQFDDALKTWRQLRDPASSAGINHRGQKTILALDDLDRGRLTWYPMPSVDSHDSLGRLRQQACASNAKPYVKNRSGDYWTPPGIENGPVQVPGIPYQVVHGPSTFLPCGGGMGQVWLGKSTDPSDNDTVVLKFFDPKGYSVGSKMWNKLMGYFAEEAEMAQKVAGDHIVKQHLHYRPQPTNGKGWRPVLVMERVAASLGDLLEHLKPDEGLQFEVIRKLVVDWATGLKRLHDEYQLVHNDLKPGNLFIRVVSGYNTAEWTRLVIDGAMKAFEGAIGDFGVAQQRGQEPSHRFDRSRDRFKAPEQDQNRPPGRKYPADPRSDLYSLGIVLKMLAGHCTSGYPCELEELVHSCCAEDIDDRPASARSLLKTLG